MLFPNALRPGWRVAANVCARRENFAWALGTTVGGIVPRMVEALGHPIAPPQSRMPPASKW